jgi:hypothetical protein
MKTISILTLGLLLTTPLNAQTINSEQLTGTWKVINGATTSELPAEVGQMMSLMLDGFDSIRPSNTLKKSGRIFVFEPVVW